jgi:two-component system, OmpR family, phosphate regulon sensor histidine kinase PhoR
MTILLTPHQSLFEVLTQGTSTNSNGPPSEAIPISPSTLKGLLASWIDLLVEQSSDAVVWAKLPRGDAWHSELVRCATTGEGNRTIYALKSLADEVAEVAPVLPLTLDAPRPLANNPAFQPATFYLSADTPLRREFFFLVVAKEFCGVIVAQRVRTKRGSTEGLEPAEVAERRNALTVTCHLGWDKVSLVLAQLETLMQEHVEDMTPQRHDRLTMPPAPIGSEVNDYLEHWRSKIAPWDLTHSHSPVGLLHKQIQRQEDLWQRLSNQRKQSEMIELLQLQNEELTRSVRSKDDFLNTVGQELRTPLTNMKTALTLLNSQNLKPPQRQRYMDLLIKECDRQSSLIGSLLDLVSLDQMAERETLKPIALSDVVPGVVSTYQPLAEEKGVQLAYTIPDDMPKIACLNPWLRQIVVGLIHNGIKFTPTGGQVWVKAKQQGDFIQLEFKDTGVGVPVQEIPKIFDRFYRVRQVSGEDVGGAGLGLTIVQQLLLRCGGSISVKSRPGDGSIFSVMLPIYQYREQS